MTLILEDGSGVAGANSYILAAFVTSYLADRNRSTENNWNTASAAIQAASCVAATDHVENKIRERVRGSAFFTDISLARATWSPAQQPADTETVTIGAQVYRFVATLALSGDVLIGDSLSESIDNLVYAVTADADQAGTAFHASTPVNDDASAVAFIDDSMVALSKIAGTAGNAIAVDSSQAANPWLNSAVFLTGGSDIIVPQALSFPRRGLYNRDAVLLEGIPLQLKYACAEYSVRARSIVLAPDPTADAAGGDVTSLREKVGPIETETRYTAGTYGSGKLPNYPAADRLLEPFLRPKGAIRA